MPQLESFAAEKLASLPPDLLAAVDQAPMPGLGDGPLDASLAEMLEGNQGSRWESLSKPQVSLCCSGLWLLAGDLDRSHTISQNISSAEGSFWHAIMHRREGDFGNSKYWFRKVGDHPVLEQMPELSGGQYDDPFEFVDACSRAVRSGGESAQCCRIAQWIEWQALMAHCVGA